MVAHALAQPAVELGLPTYGELITTARTRAHHAATEGSGPFVTPGAAADAVAGYERYLAVLGRHLRLIAMPGQAGVAGPISSMPVLHQLIHRLAALELTPSSDSPWGRAATSLATAHDLMATHLGPLGERRTPDIEVLEQPATRSVAVAAVAGLAAEPLAVRRDLLASATAARRTAEDSAAARSVAAHLRQSTDAIAQLAGEFEASLHRSDGDVTALAGLMPAIPRARATSCRSDFESALDALRLLRLLSHRQTTGLEQASPGSLHDLARLAKAASSDSPAWLPSASTPITRVQRAHAIDQMETAREAWESTTAALGQHVRGLTKAPRTYADAIRLVQLTHEHEGVRRAVLAALPRLGHEAALTTTQLTESASLTIATKQVCRFQESWRLLTPEEGQALAASFAAAGQASRAAYVAVAQLEAPRADPPRDDHIRGRALGRQLARQGAVR